MSIPRTHISHSIAQPTGAGFTISANGQVEPVSVTMGGIHANVGSHEAAVADDDRVVALRSTSSTWVGVDTNKWSERARA